LSRMKKGRTVNKPKNNIIKCLIPLFVLYNVTNLSA
jgi:hypothetical protein